MKVIKYNLVTLTERRKEDSPLLEDMFFPVVMDWSEVNETIALQEAYNGKFTIEDDGQPDPSKNPSQLDVIESQVIYTAMMTNTLLEV